MVRNLPYERNVTADDSKESSMKGSVLTILLIIVGITLVWYFLKNSKGG